MFVGAGRLADARRAATLLEQTCEGLTPHHRVHAIGKGVDLESKAGRWQEIRHLAARVEQAVEANLATPCPINVAALLECAVASERGGDDAESRRLEEMSMAIGMEGYGFFIHPPQLRLALARIDLAELARLVDVLDPEELEPSAFDTRSALFDALIALGRRERIDAEAPDWLRPGTYVEPFAIRALGAARGDESLVERAANRFEAMGLHWHAAETLRLLPAR